MSQSKVIISLITILVLCNLSFAQVTKSDATPQTLDAAVATRTFVFNSGDFVGCTVLDEVEVDLTLTLTDNAGCSAGAFGVHGDIAVSLESPSGTVVHLVHDFTGILLGSPPVQITYQDSGYPTIVNETATYDDDAALLADDQTFFGAGTWRPQNPLSAFDGESPIGTWTLRVADGRSQGFPDFTCYIGSSITIECGSGLPVELVDFNAEWLGEKVDLSWNTASERNNKGFRVERSSNLENWTSLGFIEGVGNATSLNEYHLTDSEPNNGVNFYRLIQVDFDGNETTHNTVSVDNKRNTLDFAVFPNPNNGNFILHSSEWINLDWLTVTVFDAKGTIVHQVEIETNNIDSKEINLSKVEDGVYFVNVKSELGVHHERIVIENPGH